MNMSASLSTRLNTLTLAAAMTASIPSSFASEPSHLEHPHSAGTFMIEAMYMRMNMDGLRAGTSDVSTTEATSMTGDYRHMLVPTEMTMDMFMLMPMYNISKDTSIMLMFNYLNNDMDMDGVCQSSMSTSGMADTQANISHKFANDEFAISMDLNIPTGSIDEKTEMKMMMMGECMTHEMHAPYGMQLGSGTYDLTPSITYLGAYYDLRYGAQVAYKYHIGENDNNYTLGDEAKAKLWVRKPVAGVVLSGELDIKRWGDIEGEDEKMNTNSATMSGMGGEPVVMKASPTNFTSNYGGTLAELSVNAKIPVAMAYVVGEVTFPLYQDLNGIQMKRATSFSLSVGAMF